MILWRATVALAIATFATVAALPAQNSLLQPENDVVSPDCYSKECLKAKLLSFIEPAADQDKPYRLAEGVTVVKTPGFVAEKEGAPRALDGDESIESMLLNRLQRYLQEHTLNVEVRGGDVVDAIASTGRAFDEATNGLLGEEGEGRGKKKKAAKILGPLMAALALKAAALLPLILGAIALIAGKALLVGKLALVLSAVIGLKKLLSQQKHVTYEVVAHPHHTSSHSSSGHDYGSGGSSGYADAGGYGGGGSAHGGWGRALEVAQEKAYAAQKPQ